MNEYPHHIASTGATRVAPHDASIVTLAASDDVHRRASVTPGVAQHAAAVLRRGRYALALGLAALVPLMTAGCASRDAAAARTAAAGPATDSPPPPNGTLQLPPTIMQPTPDAGPDTTPAQTTPRLHVDRDYGFSITVPAGVALRETFTPSALDNAQWQYGATAPTSGSARVALVLPGSNAIATGELRVGVSMAPNSVQQCTQIPAGAQKQPGAITLDRVGFTNFRQEDAGMNNFLTADSYRAVQKGRCYAIDLLVYGTNPQVYSPPATAPFTREEARMQLQKMLPGFRFLR